MSGKRTKKILNKNEVLEFFSSVVKGEEICSESGDAELPSLTMRFKAAELLGKCYGMFSEKTASTDEKLPVIILGEENIET